MADKTLKILMLHNKYLIRGGEDISTLQETSLLLQAGHQVDLVEYDNTEIETLGKVKTAVRSIWSDKAYKDVYARLKEGSYDLLHVQNFYPLISPSVHYAARKAGVPSVQALRNYRIICPKAQLFRDGKDCEDCVGKTIPWNAVMHKCYRGSRVASASMAAMLTTHNSLHTWQNQISAYIAVSDFVKGQHVKGGLPGEIIYTKPNVVLPDDRLTVQRKRQIAYIGRLSPEKGIDNLINAWMKAQPDGELIIAGDGPDADRLKSLAEGEDTIIFKGSVPSEEAITIMASSLAVMVPSVWNEPFGRTVIEAFSVGTPVIGSQRGGVAEIIAHEKSGLLYNADDVQALSDHISAIFKDGDLAERLSRGADQQFEECYSPKAVLETTENIYFDVIKNYDQKRSS